jgi:DNA-binding SARP family transcriptional activator/tetratricopeptide (TPR) repeat protein
VEFRLLGPLEVYEDGKPLVIRQRAQRTLLSLLLLHANRPVASDWLVEALWGGPAPSSGSAGHRLRTHVWGLRRTLAAGGAAARLQTSPGAGYVLRVDPEELDVLVFRRLAAEGRRAVAAGDLPEAVERFQRALGLWRGAALADLAAATTSVLGGELTQLEEERLGVQETLVDARLGPEGTVDGELIGELRGLVTAHPLRERLWAQLMVALYRSGRQADALAAFAEVRTRLVEELGVEPGPELQRLQRQILAADPALGAASAPAGAGVPRQLPGDVATFTGREAELRRLAVLLDPGTEPRGPVVISAIDGMGGIGKSALAIRAAHQLAERFPDGQLYLNLQGATPGLGPLEPLEALGRMLRALGTDPGQVPAEVEEAAARLRSLAAGRRLLLVLDNAHDAAQVRPLLPASPTCAVLVTSRQVLATLDLGGAQPLHLDALPPGQALELLARIAGPRRVAAEPDAAGEVVRHCGYLPLAIRIAGARLAARPAWPVGELARRLADATRRLEELSVGGIGVRASFDVSLEALRGSADPVDQAAARAFGLLSLPDGADLEVAAAARLLDQTEQAAGTLLERLVDAQLLQTPRPGRYQFHDLLRLHAREQASGQCPEAERRAALTRLFGFYTASAWSTLALLRPGDHRLATADPRWTGDGRRFADASSALEWLEAERANLLAAVAQTAGTSGAGGAAIPAALAFQLTRALYGFFLVRSHWTAGVQANQTTLELARRAGDRSAQACACSDLGSIYLWLGRYREALACQEASLVLFREAGDRAGHATSLTRMGLVHWRLGHDQEALACQRQSLALFRELGDRHGQALAVGNLGTAYEKLGCYQEALRCQQECLSMYRELGDRHGQAYALTDLGRIYQRLGRHREALGCHQESLPVFREVGDRHGEAEALRDLGDALLRVGHQRQARDVWTQALALCEALQIPEAEELRARLRE